LADRVDRVRGGFEELLEDGLAAVCVVECAIAAKLVKSRLGEVEDDAWLERRVVGEGDLTCIEW
jgi:hypothetical protein